eukprot:701736-Rhodomonas_salina.3
MVVVLGVVLFLAGGGDDHVNDGHGGGDEEEEEDGAMCDVRCARLTRAGGVMRAVAGSGGGADLDGQHRRRLRHDWPHAQHVPEERRKSVPFLLLAVSKPSRVSSLIRAP